MNGLFISFDGIDGTGKSSQIRLLCDWLRAQGRAVTTCVEPGGTPVGDMLRDILLHKPHDLTVACEALLFMASRSELVQQVIRPALAAGHVVVSDRYHLATVVYQGHAGGLDPADLWRMGDLATGGLNPDLTVVLDLPVEQALIRRGKPTDRMESRDRDFHERVRAGFLREAGRQPDRIQIIDATGEIDDVQVAVRKLVKPFIDREKH